MFTYVCDTVLYVSVSQPFWYHEPPPQNYLIHFDEIEYRLTKILIEGVVFSLCFLLQCGNKDVMKRKLKTCSNTA
jgi:hypothetical protein